MSDKWGSGLTVKVPLEIAEAVHLTDGAHVELEARNGEIVIRPILHGLTIEDMFLGKDAAEWRELYAEAYDWGPDLDREALGTSLPGE
jgi:antitoxin component of MazEF toxin-antitoxin module